MSKSSTPGSKPWFKSYPAGMPQDINPDAWPSVVHLFEAAAKRFADLPAIECFGKTISYAELDRQSLAFAAYLQQRCGVKHGDRVALMMPNTMVFPIAMLGILRAGAVQVNVNPLYTPRELEHQLNDAGVETIVAYNGSTPALAEIRASTQVSRIITAGLGDASGLLIPSPPVDARLGETLSFAQALVDGTALKLEPVEISGKDTIFFQYTGGTTGPSKGAVLSHRNLVANTEQFKAIVPGAASEGTEVLVLALPLYHIFGLMMMVAYLALGARMLLIPNPRDLDGMVRTLKSARFSVLPGVNTMFVGLLAHPEFAQVDLSNYRVAFGGGGKIFQATTERWKALTGHHILEGYGLSETSPILTANPMNMPEFSGSCGLPVPSTDIVILGDDDQPVPQGESGEICSGGPQMMSGYWNQPEASAAAFTPDGYFRTGDIGLIDAGGFLHIVDRKKDMIKVSGFNVYPTDVEAVVAGFPGVRECAAIGVPDEKTVEAVRLFVIPADGVTIDEAALVNHCRANLAAYKVPKQIAFVAELPKSAVGKILRRELRNERWTPKA